MRSRFLLGILVLTLGCGKTKNGDAGALVLDASAESAGQPVDRPLVDVGAPAAEVAIPVSADGGADSQASDVSAVPRNPDADWDRPAGSVPDTGVLPPDAASDGGDAELTSWYTSADAGTDSGAFDLSALLSGKTLTYWATATQQRPDGGLLSRNPTDQDFLPIAPVATDVVVFSDDGSTLQLSDVQGARMPMTGTRNSTDQGKWTYGLMPPPSGRLVVWLSGSMILVSRIFYGSGVPVTTSDRGEFRGN